MTRVTLELPDGLAQEAREAGILAPQADAELLRDEVRRRRSASALANTMDRLQAASADDGLTDAARQQLIRDATANARAERGFPPAG